MVRPPFLPRMPRGVAMAATLAFGLGGCSWLTGPDTGVPSDAQCPETRIVPELSSVERFAPGATGAGGLAYGAALSDLTGKCVFTAKDSVAVEITVRLTGARGPQGQPANVDFPYFIAIQDPNGQIIAKRVFSSPLDFSQGKNRAGAIETLDETIPIASYHEADRYEVLVGLQLTADELAYNRKAGVGR